jgi:hypothetical protein
MRSVPTAHNVDAGTVGTAQERPLPTHGYRLTS